MRGETRLYMIIYEETYFDDNGFADKRKTRLSRFALTDELRKDLAESYHNYYCPGPGFTDLIPYSRWLFPITTPLLTALRSSTSPLAVVFGWSA
jgi:hypothetical protein